jgi:CheY-like chemotaxis protein
VADDNSDAAYSLALLLKHESHEVQAASDGIEAMEIMSSFRPDVAFLDIGMPRLDGYGLARWIRNQPWGKSIVLVALTGWGQEEDRRRTHEAGFNFHMVKPVELSSLLGVLSNSTSVHNHI